MTDYSEVFTEKKEGTETDYSEAFAPQKKPSLIQRIRRKLPYQKEVTKGLGAFEEKGGKFLKERILPDVPAVAQSFLEMPKHLHPLAQLLEMGKTGRGVVKDIAKGKPLAETYLDLAERPFGVGLAVRTARRPKETWVEHPLPSGIEALMALSPFLLKGARLAKPKITPKEVAPKIKPPTKEPALGQPEMEMAKELKRRGVTEKPAEIPPFNDIKDARTKINLGGGEVTINDSWVSIGGKEVVRLELPSGRMIRMEYDVLAGKKSPVGVEELSNLKNLTQGEGRLGITDTGIHKPTVGKMVEAFKQRKPSVMERPITMVLDNKGRLKVLEGEHRFAAAKIAGVEPPMVLLTEKQTANLNALQIDALAKKVYTGKNVSQLTDFYNQAAQKAKPTGEVPLEQKPGVMGGVQAKGQEASVQNVMDALKEAKPLRGEQEALYTKERGARLAKVMAVRKKTTGEAGFYAELGQLKGELPKVAFESLRKKISQTDIDNLFNKVRDSEFLTEWEKPSAGKGLIKMFGEYGGRVPTKGELILLERVFSPEFVETLMAKRPLWARIKEAGWQLANIPRSAMASFDLSFGGRQGAFAAPRFRKQFWSSWKEQFKIFGSEKAYQASRQALTQHPDFMFARESKVSFTEVGKIMTQREEIFMSQWAEKIPIAGRGIRASSRAYTSFANKFRLDIFSKMVKDAEAQGFKPRENPYLAKRIADFVNNATGRGSLGGLQGAAVALNAIFFSPRLNVARLKLLNPALYIKRPKFVRREALKTALAASGTAVTMLTLAKLAGLEAGFNPLSADFGKIKIRNTRIDLLAGFGQFIRAGAQLIMGKTISTTTGKETILGEGYKPRTRMDILIQQVEYKESPVASFATTLLKGRDFAGKPVSVPKEVGRRFVPMVVADIVELAKEDPKLLPLGVLPFFGMGMQTYAHFYDKMARIEKREGRSPAWYKAKKELMDLGFKYNAKKYAEYYRGLK